MDVREHRFDPLTGDGVVLVDERVPDRVLPLRADGPVPCALCSGHEVFTGRTLAAVPTDGPWSARAVAHHTPALRVEESGDTTVDGAYLKASGLGAHEVLVESPEHPPLHEQPVARSIAALELAMARLRDLRQDRRLVTFSWWRDEGQAPTHHPHAQLLALPYVPEAVARAVSHQVAWAGRHGGPLIRELLSEEERDGRRVVKASPGAVVLCPWAPRASFEVWVVPRYATGFPGDAPPDTVAAVATEVWRARRALAGLLGGVAVSTSLVTGPADVVPAVAWFVRLRPRTVVRDGFEDASGTVMVGVFPEEAAALLRTCFPPDEDAVR